MKKDSKGSYWKDGLSVNETRFSVLVVMALAGFGYALYSHFDTGDITANLLDLVKVLIFSIVGMNVADFVTEPFRSKREDNKSPTYNVDTDQEETVFKTDPDNNK
ncbi:hypothetical protein BXO87_02150 [Bacillus sp. GZB]|uniref:hypothetical protein n=1 Tax=Bacillus TaxID=1386 RepID=UPI000977B5E1|nr:MULTISPECIES: hypothetical protein [Bacillus]MCZ4246928.1 hypothetical protein [Bacillus amyloliquefaciens]OMQ06828.1 hypothetical protein BXO87_02150 [Bacillus sp. GZB]